MTLTLTYTGQTQVPVEIEGLTPDRVRSKTLDDIRRIEIFHGNRKVALDIMFDVAGDASDEAMVFEGDLSGVHWIGAHMRSGHVHIQGPAGRHIGSEMYGGEIQVDGDAGGWVGAEMHGGLIRVRGSAGHLVGAAYRGSRKGMTGGTILIGGDVGNEVGHSIRRGWIAVGGRAGDMIGFNMIAGSVFVFGGCGIRPGAGMRRGTIGLFGDPVPQLLPSFSWACQLQPTFLSLMLRKLAEYDFAFDPALRSADCDLYHGDLVALGKGEILMRHD